MIEKILERFYNIDPQEMMTEEQRNVLRYCTEIVQEVAKEYEEKKYYRIVLSCLEDSTSLEMPLTEQEYLFLTRLSDLVYRVATGCMPTMYVEQKGE